MGAGAGVAAKLGANPSALSEVHAEYRDIRLLRMEHSGP